MPSLKLRDEQLRAAAGLLVPEQQPQKQPHRTRQDTEALIIKAVYSSHYPLSPTEILRAIGRPRSPYYIGIVRSLARRGLLVEQEYQYRRTITARVYSAAK